MKNPIVHLTAFLLIVTGVCGLAIGYVNGVTEPIIAVQDEEKLVQGYNEVYPGADQYTIEEYNEPDSMIVSKVIAVKDSETAGVLYMVETKGYGGTVSMLIGFDLISGKTTGLKILSQGETPGLGGNCEKPWFLERFVGKDVSKELKLVKVETFADDEVQAITAATVTSTAVVVGVDAARVDFVANYR